MEKGKITHSPLFLVRMINNQTGTRIAAVAPNKIFKKAVERNKIRRKIYEVAGKFKNNLVSGSHMIIFAKAAVNNATKNDILSDLKTLFVKGGVMR